ncbi:MAG: MBL fold metallo-hydrolase [Hyphomicrobiaceae bacterium]
MSGQDGVTQDGITRRRFGRALAGAALLPLSAAGVAPLVSSPAAAFQSTRIGAADVLVISDGHLQLPVRFAFPDVAEIELAAALGEGPLDGVVLRPDCNVTLARVGSRTILFDVGAGSNFMPTAGELGRNLEAAGVDPKEVTDVLFTHAHPDHLWGLLDDFDEVVFENASYRINALEWDYWRASDTLAKTPDDRKMMVVGAQSRLEVLADRIEFFAYGEEVVPGVEAVDTSGHTPGHASFILHSEGDSVMIVGDALTNVAISFGHPDWPSGADQDSAKGIATRQKLLDRLATDALRMVGFHMPHPGLGAVERAGSGYRFVATA